MISSNKRRISASGAAFALMAVLFTAATASPAGAIEVSNEAELRAAFGDVNETEIVLTADVTLIDCSAGGGDVDRVDGDPLTLRGQGFTIEQTCADESVIELEGTNDVEMLGVTITGGDVAGLGGGIYTRNGELLISQSSIVDNNAVGSGGGINGDFTDITIVDSTIAGNSAANTGGVYTNGDLLIANSTVTGNESFNNTGGVRADGNITLFFATIVGNTGPEGANVGTQSAEEILTSFGSIIALPAGGGANCSLTEPTTSAGYNFSDDPSCDLTETGDIQDGGDPLLGPLADNGGATLTRMPASDSPVIDQIPAGDSCPDPEFPTDQRGIERPVGPACDIGAVEAPLPVPPSPVDPDDDRAATNPDAVSPRFTG